MFRRCIPRLYVVHSPRGINFTLGPQDAVDAVNKRYSKRWFGAQTQYLNLGPPTKEFLPFYYCNGRIEGIFTATVAYNESTTDASGKSTSSTRHVYTDPQPIESIFEENRTQNYAGYKYNIVHVHTALKDEQNTLHLKKLPAVNMAGAQLHLFEQSTTTMKTIVERDVRVQAENTARAMVRAYHPRASNIAIHFSHLNIIIDEVTPVFMPCYVITANYDEQEYRLYVSGLTGKVGGPYLLNALYIARTTGAVVGLTLFFLSPNKVAGLFFGSAAGFVAYFLAFYAARHYPRFRRDRLQAERAKLRQEHQTEDTSGYRPNTKSQRITEEYHKSSYWSGHAYEQKKTSGSSSSSSSSSGSTARSSGTRVIRDPKGYYKTLQLRGDESVNEIRSAYRRLVLTEHPDVGGSTQRMAKINEAYRVLRDPKRRDEYDKL